MFKVYRFWSMSYCNIAMCTNLRLIGLWGEAACEQCNVRCDCSHMCRHLCHRPLQQPLPWDCADIDSCALALSSRTINWPYRRNCLTDTIEIATPLIISTSRYTRTVCTLLRLIVYHFHDVPITSRQSRAKWNGELWSSVCAHLIWTRFQSDHYESHFPFAPRLNIF